MDAHIYPAVGDQCRRQEGHPAPATVKKKYHRRHGKIIRGMPGGKGIPARRTARSRIFHLQRLSQRKEAGFCLGQIQSSHPNENLMRTRASHQGFQRIHDQRVRNADRQPNCQQHHSGAKSSKRQNRHACHRKNRPPEIPTRGRSHDQIECRMRPGMIDEIKDFGLHRAPTLSASPQNVKWENDLPKSSNSF